MRDACDFKCNSFLKTRNVYKIDFDRKTGLNFNKPLKEETKQKNQDFKIPYLHYFFTNKNKDLIHEYVATYTFCQQCLSGK